MKRFAFALAVPSLVVGSSGATLTAPASFRVGQKISVTARGVATGTRVLTLAQPPIAGSPSTCGAELQLFPRPSSDAHPDRATGRPTIPSKLQCRLPDGTRTAVTPVVPGRYFLVLCIRESPQACDGTKTFIRKVVRVIR